MSHFAINDVPLCNKGSSKSNTTKTKQDSLFKQKYFNVLKIRYSVMKNLRLYVVMNGSTPKHSNHFKQKWFEGVGTVEGMGRDPFDLRMKVLVPF